MQFGRTYEEFTVGDVYRHWPGKTVTEYDDHLFCLLTMNHHPLHMDSNYAEKTTDFGKNVVVGNYIYSLLLGMSVPDVSGKAIANLEVESLKHVAPTFHGDTIYGETEVLDKTPSKSKSDRGSVHVQTKGYKQDGTLVCVSRRKVMVPTATYIKERGGEQPPGYGADAYHYILMRILMAARTHDLQAIDGPYLQIKNVDGYREVAGRAAALGFDGKWVLHPGQVEAANEVFSPSQKDYDHAELILDAYEYCTSEAGGMKGSAMLGDEMIDEASRKMALVIAGKGRAAGMVRTSTFEPPEA